MFYQTDVIRFLRTYSGPPFDIIFADPPYAINGIEKLPNQAIPFLKPDGLFVLEHDQRHAFDDDERLMRSKAYGRTTVSIFQNLN